MYIPTAFAEPDLSKLHEFIEQNSFGVLVSQVDGLPFASHLPFFFSYLESESAASDEGLGVDTYSNYGAGWTIARWATGWMPVRPGTR